MSHVISGEMCIKHKLVLREATGCPERNCNQSHGYIMVGCRVGCPSYEHPKPAHDKLKRDGWQ